MNTKPKTNRGLTGALPPAETTVADLLVEQGRRISGPMLAQMKSAVEALEKVLAWAQYDEIPDKPESGIDMAQPEETGQLFQAKPAPDTAPDGSPAEEMQGTVMDFFQAVRMAFNEIYADLPYWPMDILIDHSELGSCLVVRKTSSMETWAVPFTGDGEELPIVIAEPPTWQLVVATYAPVSAAETEAETPASAAPAPDPSTEAGSTVSEASQAPTPVAEAESGLPAPDPSTEETPVAELETVQLAESEPAGVITLTEAAGGADVPLYMEVEIIQPGFGNSRDNHFYSREMLARDARVFAGAKMYETDHRQSEKNTRTWVSTVKQIKGFSEAGAPIAEVIVHDAGFASRVRALNEAGMLNAMECSIQAVGHVRAGEVDGKKVKVIVDITEAASVDWVTRGGAGGRAVALAESEDGAPAVLPLGEVADYLAGYNLPAAIFEKLAGGVYASLEELETARTKEIEYLKELTGSGKPFAQVGSQTNKNPMTEADYDARMQKIGERYGVNL